MLILHLRNTIIIIQSHHQMLVVHILTLSGTWWVSTLSYKIWQERRRAQWNLSYLKYGYSSRVQVFIYIITEAALSFTTELSWDISKYVHETSQKQNPGLYQWRSNKLRNHKLGNLWVPITLTTSLWAISYHMVDMKYLW